MTRRPSLGVLALEGDWTDHMAENSSTRPLLQLLQEAEYVDVIHRDAATVAELEHYASKWTHKRYDSYRLVYLAFHGTPGALQLSERAIDLAELARVLGKTCEGRIVHFASCSVINVSEQELAAFKRQTRARAVSGYGTDVDWLESCAFELLLISTLSMYKRPSDAVRYIDKHYSELASKLSWRAN